MKVGISSANFYPHINTEDSIKLMKEMGFNCGEIFLNTLSEYEEDFVKKLTEEKEKYSFSVHSVHVYSSMFEPFLFDAYKRRREDMFKVFTKVCKAIKLLGSDIYTFHGMRAVDMKYINYDLIREIYNNLAYISSEYGIKLAQENVSWCMSSNLDFLKFLNNEIKYPLYYTIDLKQAYKAGISPISYIDIMGDKICNFHINDRNKEQFCLLPGKGEVDYKKILNKLYDNNYDDVAIIEVYSENYKNYDEIKSSKRHLDKIFQENIKV
ncbi:AP endonuclease [Clostridium polyendosporum]|uniref:AP endonuclease n=1 Tax=Clostridium polyendosporum TaxID=69208 RepID=A0A919RY20_9CLOT|nr:sugar phosphate isomerase/epimerase [Clostridium polyendosporum]GIM27550.1 AP endonuclease [Clostridium polyendosporum]